MNTHWVTFARGLCGIFGALAASVPIYAAGPIDKAYVRSLAAPGKIVLAVEYYDGNRKVIGRKGFASARGFQAVSPTDFRVDANLQLHLYGLEPCKGEMVNRRENFAGRCEDFAKDQLAILLKSPKVILCRAFISEENTAVQDVTCFGYYSYPGSLDTVDNFEEQLLSLGTVRLAKNTDGSLMRPDLQAAEKIGRGGFGMWADPRVQAQ